MFAIYNHYKKRQMHMENLMRQVIYLKESEQALTERILNEMERMDLGFSFSASIIEKKPSNPETGG